MSEKEKKPLKEALASIMDGLEIITSMEEEKKTSEVREERPDSFTGLLQSMVPLLILPQILPLFQQSLSQTLQSTTVNVKVESATSIIPIDISATTAIVPIEITASRVTLNVNITGQEVELNVNITGQTALLNVSISGDATVIIKAQQAGLYLADTWSTVMDNHIDLTGYSWLQPFDSRPIIQFEPAGGEKYLLEAISVSYELPKDSNVRPRLIVFQIYTGALPIIDNLVASLNITAEKPTDFVSLLRTIVVTTAQKLWVVATSYSPVLVGVTATVYLYRVQ